MPSGWNEIEKLTKEYKQLNLDQVIDYQKFNLFLLVHHSTQIEGATLTENEIQVFLEDHLTAKGKTLEEHAMVSDHWNALQYVLKKCEEKEEFTEDFIKETSVLLMKNTGKTYHTPLGTFDSSKGEYRLVNVFAGNSSFVNYEKVPTLMKDLCTVVITKNKEVKTLKEILQLAFDVHYNLVTIHPFADGNGRISRLMMNYIEQYHHQPLSIVFKEDKVAYYDALTSTREKDDITIFRKFMMEQHIKMLKKEIDKAPENTNKKKPNRLTLLF